jgi:hypothetical protein
MMQTCKPTTAECYGGATGDDWAMLNPSYAQDGATRRLTTETSYCNPTAYMPTNSELCDTTVQRSDDQTAKEAAQCARVDAPAGRYAKVLLGRRRGSSTGPRIGNRHVEDGD